MDYITFTEALRKRQVEQGMGDATSKPLAEFYRRQNWAIPSFDFGPGLWPDRADNPVRKALYDACDDWLLEEPFRLPFPECVFLHECPGQHLLIRAMEQDDGSVVMQPYARWKDGGPIHRVAFAIAVGGPSGALQKTPSETYGEGLSGQGLLRVVEGAVLDPESTEIWTGIIFSLTTISAFVLMMMKPSEDCLVITSSESPALVSANKGRASADLPPIPATRTIKIRQEAVQRVVFKRQGHHSPKSPHVRRRHERRYKNGNVRWIPATNVKGGGNIVPKRVVLDDDSASMSDLPPV
jgi:hypothetical protein